MAKKYKYNISFGAEEETRGTIELTKKEAAIVAYAFDTDNWDIQEESEFSGRGWIDVENPMEIE